MLWIPKSCASNVFKVPVTNITYGGITVINGLVFIKSFEEDYKYFIVKFSGLQKQIFPIFKLLNSAAINTFKAIKKIFVPFI